MPKWNETANEIFLQALEHDSLERRRAYLADACGTDAELRAEVESLLEARKHITGFLELPPSGVVPTLDTVPTEKLGTYIDRYKLVHEIGHGGMGMVYMAVQKEPVKRKVALKVIKPGMDTREVVARFNAERQALALMDHQCIAHVLDGGSTPSGRPYFVMELVDGTPITEYCDECRFTTGERLELFIKVCQGVQHAHQKGVIHRDIKPSNILVTHYDGAPVPKVIDFGIAKAIHQQLTDSSVYTQVAQMVGTPLYMSPEQAERTGQDVDTRTDVYSLGVLMYELLTGTTPFDKERLKNSSLDEVKRIIREEEPPRPSTRLTTLDAALETVAEKHHTDPRALAQQISGELDWIVMKTLEKDRTRRYESASDLAKDVQRYLNDEPVEACPPSMAYRIGKFYRRNRIALLTVSAIALSLILGAGIAGWQAVVATAAKDFAEEQQGLAERRLVEVDKQRKRAEANFDKAIEAVDVLLGEVADKNLKDVPQMEPVRRVLLEKALAFYQGFTEQKGDDPAVLRERVRAQQRCGDLFVLLGQETDAEKAFRESIEFIDQQPDEVTSDPGVRQILATTHCNLGWLLKDLGRMKPAEEQLRVSLDVAKSLVAERANDPQNRFILGRIQYMLGAVLQIRGAYEEAETLCRQSQELLDALVAELPENQKYRGNAAASHRNLAILLFTTGRSTEALESSRQAIEYTRQILAKHPHDLNQRGQLAYTYLNYGSQLQVQQRLAEAEAALVEAMTLFEGLVKDLPNVPRYQHALAKTRMVQGVVLEDQGKLREAEIAYRACIASFERLRELSADIASRQYDLCCAYNNLGDLLWKQRKSKAAEQTFATAIDLLRQLLAEHDTHRYRYGLATMLINLGRTALQSCDLRQAKASYEESLTTLEQLTEKLPEVAKYRSQLASVHAQLGYLWMKMGRAEESERACRKAIEICTALATEKPLDKGLQNHMATAYYNLGCLLHNTRRLAEAERAHRKATEIRTALLEDAPDSSEYRQRLAESHGALARLLAQMDRTDEAKTSLEAAIAQYRKLIDHQPESPVAYEGLARLFSTVPLESPQAASQTVQMAEKAVQMAPEFRPHWQTLCMAQYRAGDWQAAISAFQESEKLTADWDLHARLFAAMAFWQMDNREEALRLYHDTVKKIDEKRPLDEELNRFRGEAADLLQVTKESEEEKDSDNASTSEAP